jgi:hypothetical protein
MLIMACGIVSRTSLVGGLVPIFADVTASEEVFSKEVELLHRYLASHAIAPSTRVVGRRFFVEIFCVEIFCVEIFCVKILVRILRAATL